MTTQVREALGLFTRMPPHRAASRIIGAINRRVGARLRRRLDTTRPSYGVHPVRGPLARFVEVDYEEFSPQLVSSLQQFAEKTLRHEFDLLGSGPVSVRYGMMARGFGGFSYAAEIEISPDPEGNWLTGRLNPANVKQAKKLWSLIHRGPLGSGSYSPIDWQIDFKSGYRWSEHTHWRDIEIGPAKGADIKVPWELARMQHLPRLALAAGLVAHAGKRDEGQTYAAEVRAQILDFVASNPPRFGVNWRCPMDVAIRAANILLALDILGDCGFTLDPDALEAVVDSMADHARHILAYPEWSEEARGNHYFANIAGLLFMAAYLPATAYMDAVLAFVAHQLDIEIQRQFLPDGGSFEGSTSYHRLTLEMALWCVALLFRLARIRPNPFREVDTRRLKVRPEFPKVALLGEGAQLPLSRAAVERLHKAVEFARDARRHNGNAIQIGDNDSGRFINLHPVLDSKGKENGLDRSQLISLAAAVLDRSDLSPNALCIDGSLALGLTGATAACSQFPPSHQNPKVSSRARKEFDDCLAAVRNLPPSCRNRRTIPVEITGDIRTMSYPEFGLYLWRAENFTMACRCAGTNAWAGGETGHSHDDNLSLDLMIGSREVITDPGSYIYTPLPEIRRLYRGIESHYAPRPKNRTAAVEATDLFSYTQCAVATCLYFGEDGFAGELTDGSWKVLRAIQFEAGSIVVHDGCVTGDLADYPVLTAQHTVSIGYGEQTDRPVCSL